MPDEKATPCELLTWAGFHDLCRRLAGRIDAAGFDPDVIVAIARGGFAPARVLCDYLRVMDLCSLRVAHYRGMTRSSAGARVVAPLPVDLTGRRVLLVDDVSDTGDTFAAALEHLGTRGTPLEVRSAVLLHKHTSRIRPDFHGAQMRRWRWVIFPWARVEDLAHLIARLPCSAEDRDGIRRELRARHGLRVGVRTLEDALHYGARWRESTG